MFFSNHAIPIDFKDMKRRIFVMEANYKVAENLKYFGKLREVIDDPLFMPNLFTYLKEHVDLTNFQPRNIPQTEATMSRQKAQTPIWQQFFEQEIEKFIGDGWITTECYHEYEAFCRQNGNGALSNSNFGIQLRKFCDVKQRKRNGQVRRYYYLNGRGKDAYENHLQNLDQIEEEPVKERAKDFDDDW